MSDSDTLPPSDSRRLTISVVVLIVAYNGRDDLRDCLLSIQGSDDGSALNQIVVVDNNSSDGSGELVEREFPDVRLVRSSENLGFAGGNNLGWKYIQQNFPDVEFVYLLNQDTIVAPNWLDAAVSYMRQHPDVGCVQSLLGMYPDTSVVNTAGNVSHYLGFGLMTHYGTPMTAQFQDPRPIGYASGASLLVRSHVLRQVGLFEDAFFMYLEDAELGWKIRQVGYKNMLVPQSVVYHKYSFKNDYRYYYFLERNRWWLVLVYYRWRTIALLMPAFLMMELGQCVFATQNHRLWDKFRSYAFFCSPTNWTQLLLRRHLMQTQRKITDRDFLRLSCDSFDTPQLKGWLVHWVANPIFASYWAVARKLLWW